MALLPADPRTLAAALLLCVLAPGGLLPAEGTPVPIDQIQSVRGIDSPELSIAEPLGAAEPPEAVAGAPVDALEAAAGFSREQVSQIWAVSRIIGKYYVAPVDKKELLYGALQGMAKKLDAHSQFLDPKAFKDFRDQLNGSFSGVGMGMNKKEEGALQVVSYVVPGSPAEGAGLMPGDEILAVDGEDMRPLSEEEAGRRIRGPEGSRVSLAIRRPGAGDGGTRFEVSLTRRRMQSANAISRMHPGGIGYLYLDSFRDDSDSAVLQEARALKRQGMRSLVLDVRGNGGGSLQAVINIAAAFLKKGMGIVSTNGRKGWTRQWKAPADGEFSDTPLALLVDGRSASASEILAGALQDNRRAVVVGSRSYGKGSAQVIVPFEDGSALKLTVDSWFTPAGRSIQKDKSGGGGIIPDVPVQAGDTAQAQAMARIMRELYRAPSLDAPAADPALTKALELLK